MEGLWNVAARNQSAILAMGLVMVFFLAHAEMADAYCFLQMSHAQQCAAFRVSRVAWSAVLMVEKDVAHGFLLICAAHLVVMGANHMGSQCQSVSASHASIAT